MQMRLGLGAGGRGTRVWMARFFMAVFGWMASTLIGGDFWVFPPPSSFMIQLFPFCNRKSTVVVVMVQDHRRVRYCISYLGYAMDINYSPTCYYFLHHISFLLYTHWNANASQENYDGPFLVAKIHRNDILT